MDLGLQGKAVLVMASSKGLGKASALKFAEEGARVMLSSRNEEQLKHAAAEIKEKTNADVHYQVCDITKPGDIKELVQKTVSVYGTIDVLVNNAGGPPAGGFDSFSDEDWQGAFELNLLSFIRTIREVLPYMREQQSGHIVNIASMSFKQPVDNLILSNTFRTGIIGLAKTIAREVAKDNIMVNTLGPGRISTERTKELDQANADNLGISEEAVFQENVQQIPIGRYGDPEEFAKTLVFLCSSANTYVTGQAILVDGGVSKAL